VHQFADIRRFHGFPRGIDSHALNITRVEKTRSLKPKFNKGSLHTGQHPNHLAQGNQTHRRLAISGRCVQLHQTPLHQHGNAGFKRKGGYQQLLRACLHGVNG